MTSTATATVAGSATAGIGGAWTPGPTTPELAAGEVHVWSAQLDRVDGPLLDALSAPERERRDGVAGARGGRWAAARGILRALLAGYVGGDPAAIELTVGRGGKPALARAPTAERLHFSVSHSGGHGLYAAALGAEVGIDIEFARPRPRLDAVARRVLGDTAVAAVAALAPADRERALLDAWVRHEAAIKCVGLGLAEAAAHRGRARAAIADLWVADLPPVPGVAGSAALASTRAPARVRYFRWRAGAAGDPR